MEKGRASVTGKRQKAAPADFNNSLIFRNQPNKDVSHLLSFFAAVKLENSKHVQNCMRKVSTLAYTPLEHHAEDNQLTSSNDPALKVSQPHTQLLPRRSRPPFIRFAERG
jgi:hypothetical protein